MMCGAPKMRKLLTILWLNISLVVSAPLLQLLQPYPRIGLPPPQQNLQQQLMELQAMQQFNQFPQFGMNQLEPFIILLPDQSMNTKINTNPQISDRMDNELQLKNDKTKTKDDDEDSVVIDADSMNAIPILEEQKAFLVIPNARLSIGDLISAIPFLPIEINVPDTISWAYDGISSGIAGIISIIGSRLPFRRPQDASMKNVNLKSIINELQLKNRNSVRPIVVMPLGGLNRLISPFRLVL